MKCDLNAAELEDMHSLFCKINQAQADIKTGISAQENYAETINEINGLSVDDSEYGEELCRRALDQLGQIRQAELAEMDIQNFRRELAAKYELPSGRPGDGAAYGQTVLAAQ